MEKPRLEQNDKTLASLKNIRATAALGTDEDFNFLCKEVENFVKRHEEECNTIPRVFRKQHWQNVTNAFIEEIGAVPRLFSSERANFDAEKDRSWPEDKTDITFLIFALIKFYSTKNSTPKKRSEEDAQSPTSSKSSKKSQTKSAARLPTNLATEQVQASKDHGNQREGDSLATFENVAAETPPPSDMMTNHSPHEDAHTNNVASSAHDGGNTTMSIGTNGGFQVGENESNAPVHYSVPMSGPTGHGATGSLTIQELVRPALTVDIWINGYKSPTSKPIVIHTGVTFTEFYGEVMVRTISVKDRVAIAKARSCWFKFPGGTYTSFDINETTTESIWRFCMKTAAAFVGKNCQYEGQTLIASFVGDSEEHQLTVSMAEVEQTPLQGLSPTFM